MSDYTVKQITQMLDYKGFTVLIECVSLHFRPHYIMLLPQHMAEFV